MEERRGYVAVHTHNALGSSRVLFFDVVPYDDFVHQMSLITPPLFVVALGAR